MFHLFRCPIAKDSGGILVREARDLKSPACAMRLAKDSEIQQLELIGHSAAIERSKSHEWRYKDRRDSKLVTIDYTWECMDTDMDVKYEKPMSVFTISSKVLIVRDGGWM